MIFANSFVQPAFPSPLYLAVALSSALLHFVLYKASFHASALLWPRYFNIPKTVGNDKDKVQEHVGCHSKSDQVEWASRVVSNIHATIVFLWGMYIFWTTPEFYAEHSLVAEGVSSFHSALLYSFSNGYFLMDLYLVLRYMNDTSSVVHHVIVGLSQWVIMIYGKAYILGVSISVTEATTVFVNQRYFFAKTGIYDWRYKLNGVFMFVGFLLFRVTYTGYIIFLTLTNFSSMLYPLLCECVESYDIF